TGLPNGTFTVDVIDAANVLDGAWHTLGLTGIDNDSQTDPRTLTVTGGATYAADFGYYKTVASLGDFVWKDANRDGLQTAGETGISGAVVTLIVVYPNGDTTSLTTTTNASGGYAFWNLLADENYNGVGTSGFGGTEPYFQMSVAIPTGFTPSPVDQGSNDAIDSESAYGQAVALVQGVANTTYDFGFMTLLGAIGDRVWLDENGDGLQNAGEMGIPYQLVTLTGDTDGNGTQDTRTTYTDVNGAYLFVDLVPGPYNVTVTPTSGLNPTYDLNGIATANTTSVTLPPTAVASRR
ncbi:MAG TPA: SdrD B-like domain-containing protein, partial [Pirellulaceae bacterium]|nr:SdrD B-like domain-containing protein [Pirellulaceae bacterium]